MNHPVISISKTMKLGLYVFRSSHILKARVSCTHANRPQQRKYKMRVSVLCVFSETVFLCKYCTESSKYSKKTIFKWPHGFLNRNNKSINLTYIILLYIITVCVSRDRLKGQTTISEPFNLLEVHTCYIIHSQSKHFT